MKPSTWLGPSETGASHDSVERRLTASAKASTRGPSSPAGPELVSLSDVNEIELLILKRMREFTIGEHSSLFHGSGFDFTGLRDWQAGDRFESIDWPQSSLTNFSPLVVREFEQPSTSSVVIVADASLSTRCGVGGVPIATIVARAVATLGMSAVFFQDSIGLVTFQDRFQHLAGLRPRIGKNQVISCLDAYTAAALEGPHRGASAQGRGRAPVSAAPELKHADTLGGTLAGFLRKTSMVPVVSDFLFDDAEEILRELAQLNSLHDVFVALVDASFAFELPSVSAGWIDAYDVETGRTRVMSRRDLRKAADRVRSWQDSVAARARVMDLDIMRLSLDQTQFDIALMEFVIARRLRRK
jgi:uncharacterized protein (DUF58 family)